MLGDRWVLEIESIKYSAPAWYIDLVVHTMHCLHLRLYTTVYNLRASRPDYNVDDLLH
jgi:hypothetical protein